MRWDIRDSNGKHVGYISDEDPAEMGCYTVLLIIVLSPFIFMVAFPALVSVFAFFADIHTIPRYHAILLSLFIINGILARFDNNAWEMIQLETVFLTMGLIIYFAVNPSSYLAGIQAVSSYTNPRNAFAFIPIGLTLIIHSVVASYVYSAVTLKISSLVVERVRRVSYKKREKKGQKLKHKKEGGSDAVEHYCNTRQSEWALCGDIELVDKRAELIRQRSTEVASEEDKSRSSVIFPEVMPIEQQKNASEIIPDENKQHVNMAHFDVLKQLKELNEIGILTDEEYIEKQKEVLNRIWNG